MHEAWPDVLRNAGLAEPSCAILVPDATSGCFSERLGCAQQPLTTEAKEVRWTLPLDRCSALAIAILVLSSHGSGVHQVRASCGRFGLARRARARLVIAHHHRRRRAAAKGLPSHPARLGELRAEGRAGGRAGTGPNGHGPVALTPACPHHHHCACPLRSGVCGAVGQQGAAAQPQVDRQARPVERADRGARAQHAAVQR